MAGVKRKRNAQDGGPPAPQAEAVADMPKYTTGKALRDAVQVGSKDHLRAAEYQIRVPHSTQPVAISHPTILLIQNYLALSPALDEVFAAWRKGHERKDQDIEAAAVHLLASIIHSLTPIPYFQTILEGLAEKVLETGKPWAGWLNLLISSSTRDLALPGLSLASALLNISANSTSSFIAFGTVPPASAGSASRLNTKIWQSLIEGGVLRSLPKLLSMRRKGGFAIGADPLDKPDIRHNALNMLLPLISNPTFLSGCKPLLPSVFSNLASDPPITVVRVLATIWSAINFSAIPAVNRKTASTLLTEQSIEGIVKLYPRDGSGPDDVVQALANGVNGGNGDQSTVAEVAHSFLMGVCTRPGVGICFPDNGWYKRKGKERSGLMDTGAAADGEEDDTGGLLDLQGGAGSGSNGSFVHNRTSNNVIRKIGPKAPEDSRVAALVEGILGACPELVAGFWPYSGLSLDPKLSSKWIATLSFIGRVISSPLPAENTFRVRVGERRSAASVQGPPKVTAPPLSALIEAILPSPLSKHHLSKGLQGSVGLIQHLCALTLARALQKLGQVQALLLRMGRELEGELAESKGENSWYARLRELEFEMRKRVPDVPVIVGFAQRSAASQALQASLEDSDLAAKARAELLTESALRLFELYYETLPTISSELRFDVGKLLVSSSNAKQEAEFRKNSPEESVFSDTGSIASMGTVGTIGMGGGFGQARGDVEGFDTLSQMHVLELLAKVKEWSWTAKASGSTHSYLFHVLQLYLSTPHAGTKARVRSLLQDMVGSSILFDHDPDELDLWLQALPSTRDPSVPAPAALVLHQTNLLDFLDDCARRAMKTPFRYAEMAAQLTGTKNPSPGGPMPSLLLFAMLEQLEAKVGGHLISTDGALAIILYVKLYVMLLPEKGVSLDTCEGLLRNFSDVIIAAEAKRGIPLELLRRGVADAAEQYQHIFGGTSGGDGQRAKRPRPVALFDGLDDVERGRWFILQETEVPPAFGKLLIGIHAPGILAGVPLDVILSISSNLPSEASDAAARSMSSSLRLACSNRLVGFARTCLRRLGDHAIQPTALRVLLLVLHAAHERGSSVTERAVKEIVFSGTEMTQLFAPDIELAAQEAIASLLSFLDAKDPQDTVLSKHLLETAVRGDISPDQAMKLSRVFAPLTGLMTEAQASRIVSAVAILPSSVISSSAGMLSSIIRRLSPAAILNEHFDLTRSHGLYGSAFNAMNTTAHSSSRAVSNRITLQTLWSDAKAQVPYAKDILEILLRRNETARAVASGFVCEDESWSFSLGATAGILSRLDTKAGLSSYRSGFDKPPLWSLRVVDSVFAISPLPENAIPDLCEVLAGWAALPEIRALIAGRVLEIIKAGKFRPSSSSLGSISALAERSTESENFSEVTRAAGDDTLKWMIKHVAGNVTSKTEDLATLGGFIRLSHKLESKSLSGYFAEPILTAVVQDRLGERIPVAMASKLCRVSDLKASVIRQHLQLLFDSSAWRTLTRTRSSTDEKDGIVGLVRALFEASPYIACQAAFIEPLVDIYGGTTSKSDADVMDIFELFERQTKTSAASILTRWRMSGSGGRTASPNAFEAITSLDPQQVFAACILSERKAGSYRHPVTLSSEFRALDSRFLVALYECFLRKESVTGLEWVEVLRSGVLGILVVGLSARAIAARRNAGRCLSITLGRIKVTPFHEQADVMRVLRLARHAISADEQATPDRLPFVITLFLAHSLRSISEPSFFLFPLVSRFLLQRPILDIRDIPMFYGMLFAIGQSGRKERRWIARFVRDACRGEFDWRVMQRRHTFALLASVADSSEDYTLQRTVLQATQAITFLPTAAALLTEKEGLIQWLLQRANSQPNQEILLLILAILDNVTANLNHRDLAVRSDIAGNTNSGGADGTRLGNMRRRRWLDGIPAVLITLIAAADYEALHQVATLCLRVNDVAPVSGVALCIRGLSERLRELWERDGGGHREQARAICDLAIQSGLKLDPAGLDDLPEVAACLLELFSTSRERAGFGPVGPVAEWMSTHGSTLE